MQQYYSHILLPPQEDHIQNKSKEKLGMEMTLFLYFDKKKRILEKVKIRPTT